jgi:hypothetical protein
MTRRAIALVARSSPTTGATTTKRKARFVCFLGHVEPGHGEPSSITSAANLRWPHHAEGFRPKGGRPLSSNQCISCC